MRSTSIIIFLLCLTCLSLFAQEKETVERIIYIPYKKLEGLIKKTETGIYLPYKDYRKLISDLDKAQKQPELSLVLISDASYKVKVVENFLRIIDKATSRYQALNSEESVTTES